MQRVEQDNEISFAVLTGNWCNTPAWPLYEDLISRAMEQSYRAEDTVDQVLRCLVDGEACLIEICRGAELLAVSVLEWLELKDGLWLNVWGIGGSDMGAWLDDFLGYLDICVESKDAAGVMCGGRVGWEKELGGRGWKRDAVIMRKRARI